MNGFFYGLVVMNLLFATCTVCLLKPSIASVAATVGAAVLWLLFNGPLEGKILLSLDEEHGVTVSDLMSVVAVGIAVRGWFTIRKAGARTDSRQY